MKDNFNIAFNIVIGNEGGYVYDPDDPGGETKYGISKGAYPDLNIKSISLDQAWAIYRKDYWQPTGCENLPFPKDIIVFDAAVNHGVTYAKSLVQEKDWKDILFRRLVKYLAICRKNPTQKKFVVGWLGRILSLWAKFKDAAE